LKKGNLIIVWIALMISISACSEGGTTNSVQSDKNNTPMNEAPTSSPLPIPSPDPGKKSTIVFSMYGYDPYFEDVKNAYERKHPNITIDLKYITKDFDRPDCW
jgi:multiple sugar transport system substrate-binding protein